MNKANLSEHLINVAIRFVSFRPRSEKEFREFLKKKNRIATDLEIIRVISRMRELGYVDDQKFALWWIDQRQQFKPKGERVLTAELRAKGISQDIIRDVLIGLDADALAIEVLEKKLRSWQKYTVVVQKKKAYDLLARRGFDYDLVSRVVDARIKKS